MDEEPEPWPPKFRLADSTVLSNRKKWIANSKVVYFVIPLHIDFFQCERLLPPNIDMKLRLVRAAKNFGIVAPEDDYIVKIVDLRLRARKILATYDARKDYEMKLMKNPAIFPYPMSKIRTLAIPSGVTSFTHSNVVSGRLPRSIILGMLHTESYSGKTTMQPYYFHHFNLSNLYLRINGQTYPSEAFQPDWASGKYIREFRHTIDSCGIAHDNISNGLTPEKFANGKTLFCFDLSPDVCNGAHLHINK